MLGDGVWLYSDVIAIEMKQKARSKRTYQSRE
jgi:hypothetical protein